MTQYELYKRGAFLGTLIQDSMLVKNLLIVEFKNSTLQPL